MNNKLLEIAEDTGIALPIKYHTDNCNMHNINEADGYKAAVGDSRVPMMKSTK